MLKPSKHGQLQSILLDADYWALPPGYVEVNRGSDQWHVDVLPFTSLSQPDEAWQIRVRNLLKVE